MPILTCVKLLWLGGGGIFIVNGYSNFGEEP
jgi:hypothetical protein